MDIIECIELIEQYVQNLDEEDFYDSPEKQDATIRRLEIIGEAAKNVSPEIKKLYPDISWRDVAGFRDILVHAYFGVTLRKVWKVLHQELPKLKELILQIDLSDIDEYSGERFY